MPIHYGTYTKQLKLLPLTLHDDGSATCTARFGFVGDDGAFQYVEGNTFTFSPADVSSILDAVAAPNLTRRDDLSLAIYTHLVTHGLVEAGTIT